MVDRVGAQEHEHGEERQGLDGEFHHGAAAKSFLFLFLRHGLELIVVNVESLEHSFMLLLQAELPLAHGFRFEVLLFHVALHELAEGVGSQAHEGH